MKCPFCAEEIQDAAILCRPLLARQGVAAAGRVVLGTVEGDLHDIGKNLVGAMLEGGGFEVIDLGVDVPPEKFAAAIEEKAPRAGYHGCPLRSPLITRPPGSQHADRRAQV